MRVRSFFPSTSRSPDPDSPRGVRPPFTRLVQPLGDTTMNDFDRMIGLSEAMEILSESRSGLYAKLRAGTLTAVKDGGATKIRASELRRYIDSLPRALRAVELQHARRRVTSRRSPPELASHSASLAALRRSADVFTPAAREKPPSGLHGPPIAFTHSRPSRSRTDRGYPNVSRLSKLRTRPTTSTSGSGRDQPREQNRHPLVEGHFVSRDRPRTRPATRCRRGRRPAQRAYPQEVTQSRLDEPGANAASPQ